jgi:hypothetical protein
MSATAAQTVRLRPLLPSEANDAIVTAAYTRFREHKDRTAIKAAALRLQCPRWQVNRRAKHLGLARIKEQPWSEQELALLERLAHHTPEVIGRKMRERGFARTTTGVLLKRKRLKLRANVDGYSLTSLSRAMGVDQHVVKKWVKAGWLRATMNETARLPIQGGDSYHVSHSAVYAFAMAHPDEIDLCKVEKFWFLDLITQGRICR